MSFSINANSSASTANLHSSSKSQGLSNSLGMLSSGSKLNNAAQDAAGLSIANQLSAQVAGLGMAIQNSNESIGMIQIADGAMSGIQDNMDRIRVLTLQASNGTMNADDKLIIQKEIDGLLESIDDIASQTSYNGMKLLDGTGGSAGDGTFVTHSGADSGETQSMNIGDTRVASLLGSIDVTSDSGLASALDTIDTAMTSINETRAELGASQNQLMSNVRNISVTQVNVASAESQIRDIDFAAESVNFSQQNIMSQISVFAQSQANANTSNIARLFGA